jgi:hypothetical protein
MKVTEATPPADRPAPMETPLTGPSPEVAEATSGAEATTVEATPAPELPAAPEVAPPRLREPLTPAERKALLRPGPISRKERAEAIAEARRARGLPVPEDQPPGAGERPAAAPQRAARTRINLEVEASQPSTGSQISALYGEVLIDNRSYRTFVIRFTGANSFARWKKVENLVLEDVPLKAREITVAVATDSGLNEERMEGSTRLSLEGEETNLSVSVRFYNQFDKSVKFR